MLFSGDDQNIIEPMSQRKRLNLALLGIDGLSHELILSLGPAGILPNLYNLAKTHGLKQLQAPLPEVSSVSWTSLMTGLTPGEHGIFGFYDIDKTNYSYIYPYFPTLPVQTIWEKTGNDFRSIIINLPNTYPARPLNGLLVSGFVTIDEKKAVYPKTSLPLIKKLGYRFDPDFSLLKKDKREFIADLNETLARRTQFLKQVIYQNWNLLFFIITETDRLNHFFFKSVTDPRGPYHNECMEFYHHVDSIIGELTTRLEGMGIPYVILSDHGFRSLKKEVYISQYLKEWNFLHLGGGISEDLTGMDAKTRVFCLDPSRIYLNHHGKYRRGSVKKRDVESLLNDVKQRCLEINIEGEKAIKHVFLKRELYRGEFLANAPDIVLLANDGFDLKSGLKKTVKFGTQINEGMHTWDNAFLIDSLGFDIKNHANIYQVCQKIESFFK